MDNKIWENFKIKVNVEEETGIPKHTMTLKSAHVIQESEESKVFVARVKETKNDVNGEERSKIYPVYYEIITGSDSLKLLPELIKRYVQNRRNEPYIYAYTFLGSFHYNDLKDRIVYSKVGCVNDVKKQIQELNKKRRRFRIREEQGTSFIEKLTNKIKAHGQGETISLKEFEEAKWYSDELNKFNEVMKAVSSQSNLPKDQSNGQLKEQSTQQPNGEPNGQNNIEKEDEEHEEI